jgi:hypothetical protein
MGPHLSDQQVERVIEAVREAALELAVTVPRQTRRQPVARRLSAVR